MVKQHEILYNKSKTGYKNIKLKAEIWQKIAETLDESGSVLIYQFKSNK